MKKLFTKLIALSAIGLSHIAVGQMSDNMLFTARLSGDESVPAVTTNATGVGSAMLNSAKDSLCIDIKTVWLSGPITGIHLHDGAIGQSGGVLYNLTSSESNGRIQSVITGTDLTSDLLESILKQEVYINVHTADNPGGEIRGQLVLETDWQFKASLDTLQQNHAVTAMNPEGLASFRLSKDQSTINFMVQTSGLTDQMTMAHLHYGAEGKDGLVAVDLTPYINGNTIIGQIDATMPSELIDSLKAGTIYLNIHTAANVAGEIRGQVWLDDNISFDSWLNTDQQNHTVSTDVPTGLSYLSLNYTMDTLWYDVILDSLTDTPTMAHIHNAAAGSDGGVLINISSGINGNRISGMIVGADLSVSNINEILQGETYINVHTAANGAGEVRGQIYKFARDGYTISLDGDNHDPIIRGSADGVGIVSIDRDRDNLHYMIAVGDLTDATTSVHFHEGLEGESGAVLYNLTSEFSATGSEDAAFGYLKSTDASPFTVDAARKFWGDSVYVNVHTTANAGGEIRGQVWNGSPCNQFVGKSASPFSDKGLLSDKMLFACKLSGDVQVPTVSTTATGVAGFYLSADQDSLCLDIKTISLSGPITGIHLHSGAPGATGGVLFDLGPFEENGRVKAVITGTDLDNLLELLLLGEVYINVHTAANAAGEIRGDVSLERDWMAKAKVETAQQNHAVNAPNASGIASFRINQDNSKIKFMIQTSGLTGDITAAHLHYGKTGTDGGVAVNLSTMIDGNSIIGEIDATTPADLVSAIWNDSIYLNVHTDANPAGEIRGQLWIDENISFDSWLDTAQQNHEVVSVDARGAGYMSLNYTMDTLWYSVLVDDQSGPLTMVHIHNAAVGSDGGVLADLSGGISDNWVEGMVTGTSLDNTTIAALLAGDAYINVHTAFNPSGELRGQVYKMNRDGYTATIAGDQHDPEVVTDANGYGIVSIDRDKENAHVMIAVSDLSGPITMAHFHAGLVGESGGVEYNLTPHFSTSGTSDAAFTYWNESDSDPFLTTDAQKFWKDSIYINIHTTANAGGEIRGQVWNGSECIDGSITAIEPNQLFASQVLIFPNPADDKLNVQFITDKSSHNLVVVDLMGNTVLNAESVDDLAELNVSNLAVGIYILRIDGLIAGKFSKN